jgi:hypothetical protein
MAERPSASAPSTLVRSPVAGAGSSAQTSCMLPRSRQGPGLRFSAACPAGLLQITAPGRRRRSREDVPPSVSTGVAGGVVTSGGRDGCIQQYRLRPRQQWWAAAAEASLPPPQPPTPPPQQQQESHGQYGPGGLQQQLGAVSTEEEADADASADAGAGSHAPGALWRKLEAAGRQALVPSSLERLPGISTPVADVVVPAVDAGSSGGGATGERIVCGWQAREPADLSPVATYAHEYGHYSHAAIRSGMSPTDVPTSSCWRCAATTALTL